MFPYLGVYIVPLELRGSKFQRNDINTSVGKIPTQNPNTKITSHNSPTKISVEKIQLVIVSSLPNFKYKL